MGVVYKMKALAFLASVVLLLIALGLAQQPAGAQDLDEAARLHQQASELYQQGRYADAEPLFKRSLEIREKSLGTDHTDVAISLNSLAILYHAQGRYADAEQLHIWRSSGTSRPCRNLPPFTPRSTTISTTTVTSTAATSSNRTALLHSRNGVNSQRESLDRS
jgi:hypothetical protein